MRTSWASLRNSASIAGSNSASETAMWSLTLLGSSDSTEVSMGPVTLPGGLRHSGMDRAGIRADLRGAGRAKPAAIEAAAGTVRRHARGVRTHGDQGERAGVYPVHPPVSRRGRLALLARPRYPPRAVAGDDHRGLRLDRRRPLHRTDRRQGHVALGHRPDDPVLRDRRRDAGRDRPRPDHTLGP